ncbi:MAG: hypothetical protein Q9N02_08235, partial [Ghiorsea sp.]|nr:hypothetical protein [Ghiorsea sp.]
MAVLRALSAFLAPRRPNAPLRQGMSQQIFKTHSTPSTANIRCMKRQNTFLTIESNSVVCSIEANSIDENHLQHVHLIPLDESGMVKGVDGRAWHCNSESILAHAAQYPAQFAGDY